MAYTLLIWIAIIVIIGILFFLKIIKGIFKLGITLLLVLLVIVGIVGFLFSLDSSYLEDATSGEHYVLFGDSAYSFSSLNDDEPQPAQQSPEELQSNGNFIVIVNTDDEYAPSGIDEYIQGTSESGLEYLQDGITEGYLSTKPALVGFEASKLLPNFIVKMFY